MKVQCAYCGKELDEKNAIKLKIRGEVKFFCNEDHLERYLGKKLGPSC
ncbi:MAG: hypothetical protein ACTSX9_02380 [Candidatus Njordarchaeales archaeon]